MSLPSRFTRNGNGQRKKTAEQARQYLKAHRKEFIHTFTKGYRESHPERPLSIFLAGSPGAGKTEYAQSLLTIDRDLLRIDADAVRAWLPMYTGDNSDVVQQAASKGVDILYDHALRKGISIILDATFTPYTVVHQNVHRSLRRGRVVQVHYVYQDPLVAWQFTKDRELVEGRFVPKDVFVRKFFEAHENVRRIKEEYRHTVDLFVVLKDFSVQTKQFHAHVDDLQSIIKIPYNLRALTKKLR